MDHVIFAEIINYRGSCRPDRSLLSNKAAGPITKTYRHCSSVLQVTFSRQTHTHAKCATLQMRDCGISSSRTSPRKWHHTRSTWISWSRGSVMTSGWSEWTTTATDPPVYLLLLYLVSFHVFLDSTIRITIILGDHIAFPWGYSDNTQIYGELFFNNREFQLFPCFFSSPKSGAFLRGVVVPGRGGLGGSHLHPAAGFHPHYQGPEQEVCQEVWIRWVHTIKCGFSNFIYSYCRSPCTF